MRVSSLIVLAVLRVFAAGISPSPSLDDNNASQFPLRLAQSKQPESLLQDSSQASSITYPDKKFGDENSDTINIQENNEESNNRMLNWKSNDFAFKTGADVFTPRDLVELPRPGEGVPNPVGDLVLVSVSTYSFKSNK